TVALSKVEMYCEEMSIDYTKTEPAVAPPPAAASSGGTQPASGGTLVDPGSLLVSALRTLMTSPETRVALREPEMVAARLLATADDRPADGTADQEERGRLLGTAWARERASLDELHQMAATRGSDWTDVRLDEGHSLPGYLQEA